MRVGQNKSVAHPFYHTKSWWVGWQSLVVSHCRQYSHSSSSSVQLEHHYINMQVNFPLHFGCSCPKLGSLLWAAQVRRGQIKECEWYHQIAVWELCISNLKHTTHSTPENTWLCKWAHTLLLTISQLGYWVVETRYSKCGRQAQDAHAA